MEVVKLSSFSYKKVTRDQIRDLMILYNYKDYKLECEADTPLWRDIISREFMETPIKNKYGEVRMIVFSVDGSPLKGIATFIADDCILPDRESCGKIFFIGNKGTSHRYLICLIPEELKGDKNG